jgi:hypothetical protein
MDSTAIWGIVGTVVAAISSILIPIIKAKGDRYLRLIKMIIDAFDDGDITKEEFTAIVSYAKTLV